MPIEFQCLHTSIVIRCNYLGSSNTLGKMPGYTIATCLSIYTCRILAIFPVSFLALSITSSCETDSIYKDWKKILLYHLAFMNDSCVIYWAHFVKVVFSNGNTQFCMAIVFPQLLILNINHDFIETKQMCWLGGVTKVPCSYVYPLSFKSRGLLAE